MGRRVTGGPLHFSTFKKSSISRDSRAVNEMLIMKTAVFWRFCRI
jgi:hypothetical protein